MKTDYTLTPEYTQAMHMVLQEIYDRNLEVAKDQLNVLVSRVEYGESVLEYRVRKSHEWQKDQFYRMPIISHLAVTEAQAGPVQKHESLTRTVCKIAARILFVLLLVGILVGVML